MMAAAPVIPIPMPPDQEISAERGDLAAQAGALQVFDQETADRAGRIIESIRTLRKKIAETFDPLADAAHKAHRAITAKRSEHDGPLASAESQLKARIGHWAMAEERKRREEAARLAAEARKRDEESRLAEATALEEAGETEEAVRVLEQAPLPPPPIAAPPKVAGVRVQQVWNVEVTDPMALIRAIAEGKAPLAFVAVDLSALKKHASATGGMAVPGVRAWQAPAVAARGR